MSKQYVTNLIYVFSIISYLLHFVKENFKFRVQEESNRILWRRKERGLEKEEAGKEKKEMQGKCHWKNLWV